MRAIDRWTSSGRRAIAGAGLYGLANALDAASALAMIPLITRATTMAVYGQLTLLLAAAGVALVVIDLGCGIALVRQLRMDSPQEVRRSQIATALWLRLGSAVVVGLFAFAISFVSAEPLAGAIRLASITIGLWGMFGGLCEVLRAEERHGTAATALVLRSLTWVTAVLYLVIANDGGLQEIVLSYAIAYAVGLAFAMWQTGAIALAWPDRAIARSLLGFGLPVAGYFGLRTVGGLDRFLVRFRTTIEDTAVFHVGNTPAAAIEIAERTSIQPAEPYLYRVEPANRDQAFARVVRLTTFVLGSSAIVLTMVGPELVALLGPPSYAAALGAVPWFTCAALARGVTRALTIGAGLVGNTRIWAIAAAVDLVLTGATLTLLLPVWGIPGAALGRFIAAAVALVTAYALLRRVWRVDLPIVLICAYILAIVGVSSVFATHTLHMVLPLAARFGIALAFLGLGYTLFIRPTRTRT